MPYQPPDFDARSLRIHQIVVMQIESNPAEIDRARKILLRWIGDGTSASQPYYAKWLRAIDEGVETCIKQMLDPSEHGDVMRSCSPFGCLLSKEQRKAVFAEFRSVV